ASRELPRACVVSLSSPSHGHARRLTSFPTRRSSDLCYGEDSDSVLNRADMLLYEAKGNGRNRIVAGLAPVQLTLDEPSEREGMACSAEAAGAAGQSS